MKQWSYKGFQGTLAYWGLYNSSYELFWSTIAFIFTKSNLGSKVPTKHLILHLVFKRRVAASIPHYVSVCCSVRLSVNKKLNWYHVNFLAKTQPLINSDTTNNH